MSTTAKLSESATLHILIVDDDAANRELMVDALAACGYQIQTACDAADALSAITTRTFDVVIADVQMPLVDGFELLGHLRRLAPSTDVILITGSGSIPDAVTATKAKAIYLTKGFAYRDLVQAVSELAERRAIEAELDRGTTGKNPSGPALLVGNCPAIIQLKRNIEVIARSDGAVVICGESGTGKELVARMIHDASPRRDKPLVTVNCAAFPDTLLEAELFGHERGAFTGAAARREGRFEAAAGGTLFLDEIAEMPLVAQAKLLRVLQEGTFQRLGSNATIKADVRIVSATNKDLEQLVAQGKFREDLFYRVKLFRLNMPPLRTRREDLPLLVRHFCKKYAADGASHQEVSAETWAVLREHSFPGNVRELEHAIRHAMAFARGEEIQVEHLPEDLAGDVRDEPPHAAAPTALGAVRPLQSAMIEFEHDYLLEVLERAEGNRSRAASMLGISRKALWAKLKRYPVSITVALVAALALFCALPVGTAHAADLQYDAFQELVNDEASAAMAEGNYARAESLFDRLLVIDENDAHALREAGRTAHAIGHHAYAERALARADLLHQHGADPELHYLRGESLEALGRHAEAEAEFKQAELELSPVPPEGRGYLWLARIYARRGEMARAEALYRSHLPKDTQSAEYAEIMLYMVEAHTLNSDWVGAERLLRKFLAVSPDHVRGREMLAWVLEARGQIDREVALRAELLAERTEDPSRALDYARALERAREYPRALAMYRTARSLGVDDLGSDISRLENRLSPEISAGAQFAEDPTGTIRRVFAASTMRMSRWSRLVLAGGHEVVSGAPLAPAGMDEVSADSLTAWTVIGRSGGAALALGGTASRRAGRDFAFGGTWALRTAPGHAFELHLGGELQMPWNESALTIREGGVVDSIGLDLYASPFTPRVVFSLNGRARRLSLAPEGDDSRVHATQGFVAAGVDYVVSSTPRRAARGEILDENMLWPVALGQAIVLSYRHYELSSDDPFGMRLVLVERSAVDEVSTVVRHVLDARGMAGVELRGGLGYDQARAVRQWRAGGSLLLSATSSSRLSLTYDVTSERGNGLSGQRHAGWVTVHVDL